MAGMDTIPRRLFGRANSRPRESWSEGCLTGRCSQMLGVGAVILRKSQSFGIGQSGCSIVSRAARGDRKGCHARARRA